MKNKLLLLGALAVFNSPLALASDDIEIDLSPVKPTSAVIEAIAPATENVIEELSSEASQTAAIRIFKHIQHVDLRDVIKYDHEIAKDLPDSADRLPGTSKKILEAIKENPGRFSEDASTLYHDKGAEGPSGDKAFVEKRKRTEFVIRKRFEHTYKNTIFSADYESAKEVAPSVYEAKLLLFIHSRNKKHHFKRITVKVDWTKNKTGSLEDVVQVLSYDQEIALSETNFNMKGSLADQKIILEDTNYDITKVFPVTVGAIDARDGLVESMNFWVPKRNRNIGKTPELKKEFQDFSNAALVKRSKWTTGNSWANAAERIHPHDYRGRPFLGLVDLNFVNLDAEKPNFAAGYREVGLHYQITRSKLERGFRSHGCVRVRDKDLYQVDAIVNHGPKDMVASVFKKELPEYAGLNHPHSYEDIAAMVKYTDFKSKANSEDILCRITPEKKTRLVRWNSADKVYHTVVGNDCLTSTAKNTGLLTTDVIDFFHGGGTRISKFLVNQEHPPVKKSIETLLGYGYDLQKVESMDQIERFETIEKLKSGKIQPLIARSQQVQNDLAAQPVRQVFKWPKLDISRFVSKNNPKKIMGNNNRYNKLLRKERKNTITPLEQKILMNTRYADRCMGKTHDVKGDRYARCSKYRNFIKNW